MGERRASTGAQESTGHQRHQGAASSGEPHTAYTQEFEGDGAIGKNTAYGNIGGNQGAVMRKEQR